MRNLISEKILLYKVKTAKDKDAFAVLYDLYAPKIFRFVYFKINNREEAEDLTSEVFLKVWHYLMSESNAEVRSFSALVYRMARNAVVDKYRERSRHQEVSIEQGVPETDLVSDVDQIREIDNKTDALHLVRHLNKLKQEYRDVITLRFMDELTFSEMAMIMGKSQLTVRVTLHRAIKKLSEITNKPEKK
ncbi:MAG TPA: RNA polymerase sigma factor [Candidatus Magasanikbacteria bacterium]|nr:RNA polymerase sigma factor [Candidatus Magasanikbacteria bacterium]